MGRAADSSGTVGHFVLRRDARLRLLRPVLHGGGRERRCELMEETKRTSVRAWVCEVVKRVFMGHGGVERNAHLKRPTSIMNVR